MRICPYREQVSQWPNSGRHILAHFDADSILVYQAYRPSIARYAVEHQEFGGEFSYSRMSWIKPNFLWMMFRSGWASKDGQEHVLAVCLKRPFFDELLREAVPSSFDTQRFTSRGEWQTAIEESEVRLQWDPDHDPLGAPLERRAIQLGLRGEMLQKYGREQLISITDITPFVIEQRARLANGLDELLIPEERAYQPADCKTALQVGIDTTIA